MCSLRIFGGIFITLPSNVIAVFSYYILTLLVFYAVSLSLYKFISLSVLLIYLLSLMWFLHILLNLLLPAVKAYPNFFPPR